MKRFSVMTLCMILAFVVFDRDPCISAWGKPSSGGITISAESFGADGDDLEDDRLAVQAALNFARDNASESSPVTVTVGDGIYYFSDSVLIYSHTRLILSDGAVFCFRDSPEGVILQGGHGKNVGYNNLTDVVISGGIWKGDAAATGAHTELIGLRCGSGITITGLSMEDSSDHFIMLTGVRDAAVKNCTFSGHYSLSAIDQFVKEAVHIDFLPVDDEVMFPSQNITVENCMFDRVASGIGTHHYGYGNYETNITVRGCTFTDLLYNCINSYSMAGLSVSGCKAYDCGSFLWMRASQGVFDSDIISGCGKRGFLIQDGSSVKITNSVIKDVSASDLNAIAVLASDSALMIEGSGISDVRGTAIRIKNSDRLSVLRGNVIYGADGQGIFASDTYVRIEDNIVSGGKGIWTQGGRSEIYGNSISGCLYGISDHEGSSRICGNTVTGSLSYGIQVTGSEEQSGSALVQGNSIELSGRESVRVGRNCSGCVIKDNCVGQPFTISYSRWSDIKITGNGDAPPPAAPEAKCSLDGDNALLSWDKVDGADYYVVCEVNTEDGSVNTIDVTEKTVCRIAKVNGYQDAAFLVLSCDEEGNTCYYTVPTNSVTISREEEKKSPSLIFLPEEMNCTDGEEKDSGFTQSGDVTVTEDGIASLALAAEDNALRFRWYFRKKGSLGWLLWSGHNSLWESAIADASWEGAKVYCVATDGSGGKYTTLPVTITVERPLRIVSEPADVIAADGDEVKFLLKAAGSGKRHYQWFYKKAGADDWSVWKGHNSPLLTAVANETWQDMQVKCLITDDNGGSIESRTLTVTIIQPSYNWEDDGEPDYFEDSENSGNSDNPGESENPYQSGDEEERYSNK